MKRLDITGHRFGSLTAIKFVGVKNNCTYWLFRCDCGREKEMCLQNVLSGKSTTCGGKGHHRGKKGVRKDLTGVRFGRLLVLRPTGGKSADGSYIWECRCDCGNMVARGAHILLSGTSESCGCLREEKRLAALRSPECFEKMSVRSTRNWPATAEKIGMRDGTNVSIIKMTRARKDSSTGVRGVSLKRPGEYVARLQFQGKTHCAFGFKTVEDAAKARQKMYEEYVLPYLEQIEMENNDEA